MEISIVYGNLADSQDGGVQVKEGQILHRLIKAMILDQKLYSGSASDLYHPIYRHHCLAYTYNMCFCLY